MAAQNPGGEECAKGGVQTERKRDFLWSAATVIVLLYFLVLPVNKKVVKVLVWLSQ